MAPQLEIQGVSVVLRGSFNAAVFQPAWLAAQDLLRPQEAETADVQLISPRATVFDAEWLQMRIVEDRFQASTIQEPYFEFLRDLVMGIFTILKQTPLTFMGINRDFHFRLRSKKALDAVGHELAPKQHWADVLKHPGLRSLAMEGQRTDNRAGYIQATVEPSKKTELGLFVHVNDHYILQNPGDVLGGSELAVEILQEQWSDSMNRSRAIAEKIADLGDML